MSGEKLWTLIEGLQQNDLLQYTHLLTGYIGSVSFLETIAKVVKTLRKANPDLVYGKIPGHCSLLCQLNVHSYVRLCMLLHAVCDPVMGDDNRLYVSQDLIPAYKDQIISLATVLTPNQYEAELLTGITIDSKRCALKACESLHDRGVATVVSLAAFLLMCNHAMLFYDRCIAAASHMASVTCNNQ